MQKQIQQLIEWHTKFEVPFRTEPDPFDDSDEATKITRLRARIMKEEVSEWEESAIYNEDINKRAKELADILYTVFGTIITEGLQDVIERVFDEVHKSNMSKLDDNGKPMKRADGKVLKGSNYKEPDLSFLLNSSNSPERSVAENAEQGSKADNQKDIEVYVPVDVDGELPENGTNYIAIDAYGSPEKYGRRTPNDEQHRKFLKDNLKTHWLKKVTISSLLTDNEK